MFQDMRHAKRSVGVQWCFRGKLGKWSALKLICPAAGSQSQEG